MTVNEIFSRALSLIPSSPGQDGGLSEFALEWTNQALAEMLECENSIRKSEGKPVLERAPKLTSLADDVPFSDKLVFTAAVYFLAAMCEKDENEGDWSEVYLSRYRSAVADAARMVSESVRDVYWGNDNG